MVYQAHQVYLVTKVTLEWVSQVLKDYQAHRAQLASLEKKEMLVCLAYEESKDFQVYLVSQESKVAQVQLDYQVHKVPQVCQE